MTIRKTITLRIIALAILFSTPIMLSACGSDSRQSSSSKSLSKSTLESELNQLQGWENNPFNGEVRGASCRGGIEVRNGATQTCDVTVGGTTRTYTITIKDDSDVVPHFGATPRN
ncbi:DUF4333 domain-containing protein [Mycobacteroides abscessus]|uniref:DUF4333 domain-containing protein n=1 Tax=Mycobacteroides abscessus TaxID=36809 RepID=UPI00210478AD|nr:DUF4333 domain-containing protein [Mycobacteroides abscessus]